MIINEAINEIKIESFEDVVQQLYIDFPDPKTRGTKFEELMIRYLETSQVYINEYTKIYTLFDFSLISNFPSKDCGIDLIGYNENYDKYTSIQCKFYSQDSTISKKHIDSFVSHSTKKFIIKSNQKEYQFNNSLWIQTSDKVWSKNSSEGNRIIPLTKLTYKDLIQTSVNWEKLYRGKKGKEARYQNKKPRNYQLEAIKQTIKYFKDNQDDSNSVRGKLIMACGTGKTYTSLCITEELIKDKTNSIILFLAPSISLISQTIHSWNNDSNKNIYNIAICSDSSVTRKKDKDDTYEGSIHDLGLPASTDIDKISQRIQEIKDKKIINDSESLLVVFSTYQSIDVISEVQKKLTFTFDLTICDEAHRTTSFDNKKIKEDKSNIISNFTKVHNEEYIKSKNRLYMTATPKIYTNRKNKSEVEYDMNSEAVYGKEIYRIGFRQAIKENILADYKVLLYVYNEDDTSDNKDEEDKPTNNQEEKDLNKGFDIGQNDNKDISLPDKQRYKALHNVVNKKIIDYKNRPCLDDDPIHNMVGFCSSIRESKENNSIINNLSQELLKKDSSDSTVILESRHIDGNVSSSSRDKDIKWLSKRESGKCKILNNVRCLSEGVDVPSLDAIIFFSERHSQIDIIQSIGRVLRKYKDKNFGYIIIPILISKYDDADKVLKDSKRTQTIWEVLNALKAYDEDFNIEISSLKYNNFESKRLKLCKSNEEDSSILYELDRQIKGKIVETYHDPKFFIRWSDEISVIAKSQIKLLAKISKQAEHKYQFSEFVKTLRINTNNSNITYEEAIEMLAQHNLTSPIFDALFSGTAKDKNNINNSSPIFNYLNKMINLFLSDQNSKYKEQLEDFYEGAQKRIKECNTPAAKQEIIYVLYDEFFKKAFPKMVEKLGIVYTPIEAVDFIIHSINDILKQEFNKTFNDDDISVLEPFSGTGTFITRLIQSGLMTKETLKNKFKDGIYANEIVLLPYYISLINIESTLKEVLGEENKEHHIFEGMVLTDTFNQDFKEKDVLSNDGNYERLNRQIKSKIKVIITNPPYSMGQRSENDNNKNTSYKFLEKRIESSYIAKSKCKNLRSLYDSYIKAIRWSTDRLENSDGIIGIIVNGGWLDSKSADGFRASIEKEFDKIWVVNLRGNKRKKAEISRKEGGNLFGSGCMARITLLFLLKKQNSNNKKAKIYYHDIGNYVNTQDKKEMLKSFKSILNTKLNLEIIKPNEYYDWIEKRNPSFNKLIPTEPEVPDPRRSKFNLETQSFFNTISLGIVTNRDSWVYNFSKEELSKNIQSTISFYNEEIKRSIICEKERKTFKFNNDKKKISWSSSLKNYFKNKKEVKFSENNIVNSMYRPFTKQNLYFEKILIERSSLFPILLPKKNSINKFICFGYSENDILSCLMTDKITDTHMNSLLNATCFPLYYYKKIENKKNKENKVNTSLSDEFEKYSYNTIDNTITEDLPNEPGYVRCSGISKFIFDKAKKLYGNNVTKTNIFYYVYAILHMSEYKEKFKFNFKTSKPKLDLVKNSEDFYKISKIGEKLSDLHLNYENIEHDPSVIVKYKNFNENFKYFEVRKIKFENKKLKDTILFNNNIKITKIPQQAYDYKVDGYSAIEWIIKRYEITKNKESEIENNPNLFSIEKGDPKYILNLMLSVISMSIKSVNLIKKLNDIKLDFIE